MLVSTEAADNDRYKNDGICINQIILGNMQTFFDKNTVINLPTTRGQLMLCDFEGNMKPTLIGMDESGTKVISLSNFAQGKDSPAVELPTFKPFSQPHSNTFVDVNRDCLADLITTHVENNEKFIHIRFNSKTGFSNPEVYKLPADTRMGSIVFHDFDGDGAIDIMFITNDNIHIAFNKQTGKCQGSEACGICELAPDFGYNMSDVNTADHMIISIKSFFGDGVSVVSDYPQKIIQHMPISPRLGDYNLDSFMDVLITVSTDINDLSKYKVKLLESVPCEKTNCSAAQIDAKRRTFKIATGYPALNDVSGVMTANMLDIANSNTFDFVIQTVNSATNIGKIVTLKNNLYQDAFILAANTIFSGQPDGVTRVADGTLVKRPYGASLVGVTYRYVIVDLNEFHQTRTNYQYAQTSYLQIVPGSALLGLGRVNSFISSFTVAVTNREFAQGFAAYHETWPSQIIPNSDLVIIPPNKEKNIGVWTIELYISPGEYVLWVIVALLASILVLGSTAFWFKRKELLADEEEKKKALHAINFDAL